MARTSPTIPSPEASDPKLSPLLESGSYTAHRLHHATPPHLHLTSRRVFVGPLPVGWLKNTSTEWYKQHFHYSKRVLSFSAQPGTVPKRRVTGLGLWEDVRGNAGAGFTHDDEMADVAEDAEGEAEAEAEEVEEDEPETLSVPVATPNFSRQRGKTVDSRPKTSDSLFPPRTLRRGESFTTAYEMWDHTDENQHPYRPRTGRAATETPSVCDHMERPVAVRATTEVPATLTREFVGLTSPHERSPAGESSVSALHSIAQDSLASLLKKDREQRGDGVDSVDSRQMGLDGQADSVLAPEPRPLQLGPSKQPKITMAALLEETDPLQCLAPRSRVSTIGHVAGGMVRFNGPTPDKEEEPKRKTTDLGRARSLGAMARRKSSLRRHDGEIVKMETMLVRIEASLSPKLPVEYDENESLKVKTRVAEKWREYVVVCRESDNPDVPMILRLYKTRSIPAVDKQYVSSRSARDIPLNPKTTRANMYSSLDKTLVIWHPHKRGSLIYIMRPRCSSSSVVWYTFLKTALGEPPCKSLQISVPDLTLTILIENPFERPEQTERNDSGEITAFKQGDVAGNLLKQSMGMLNGVHEWENILDHWKTKERMGLAWRRYDRLEWVHGANEQKMDGSIAMQKTHELELRPKSHYPTESTLADGRRMEEPAPVEGFLIRLTSGKGREKILGRSFHKRLYFAAFDQFLCFCKPSRALPPAPPKNLSRGGIVPTPREISERMPVIYSISPYRLDREENIDWLAGPDAPEKDLEAYNEAQRKITLLSRSIGFVDLAKASRVCRVGSDLEDPADLDWRISSRSGSGGQSGALSDDAMSVVIDDEKCFEIVLDNGLRLKLQAYDSQTRDEWIMRLSDLIVYWKARHLSDLGIIRRTRDINLKQLNMDEEMESIMGQFGRKWEVSRTTASSELYNVCGLSSCRTITMSGLLYRKPRRHSTFRRFNVVLSNGELLIFYDTSRGRTGKQVPTVYNEKHLTISLRDSYVYSGLLTASDLLYQNRTFDSNMPGRHSLPRIYPDGYTSQDEDSMTCFVVWHGTRRSLFTSKDEDGNKVRRRVSPLGSSGTAIVFKARSRLERDTWVTGISMEIERLNLGVEEDINIVEAV